MPFQRAEAEQTLRLVAGAQDRFFASHGVFATSLSQLDATIQAAGLTVEIARADQSGFCLLAITDEAEVYSFDSQSRFVQDGDVC